MSTLSVSQITTGDNTTPLLFTTGNGSSGFIKVETANDQILFSGTPRFTGAISGVAPTEAFTQANTARIHANAAFTQANTSRVHANVSFEQANTSRVHANASFGQANTARNLANTALQNTTGTFAGTLTVTQDIIARSFSGFGSGVSNATLFITPGSGTWPIPNGVQRFKATLVGAGGQGGGTSTSAGQTGNGGGSGGVCIKFYDVVSGQDTVSFNVGTRGSTSGTNATGQSGSGSNIQYNSTWAFANGGIGGATHGTVNGGGNGGAASGGEVNIPGEKGDTGGVAAATNPCQGMGGDTPLGFGFGAGMQGTAAGGAGQAGEGYGGGGGGGKNGSGTTARAGGAGANGAILFEW